MAELIGRWREELSNDWLEQAVRKGCKCVGLEELKPEQQEAVETLLHGERGVCSSHCQPATESLPFFMSCCSVSWLCCLLSLSHLLTPFFRWYSSSHRLSWFLFKADSCVSMFTSDTWSFGLYTHFTWVWGMNVMNTCTYEVQPTIRKNTARPSPPACTGDAWKQRGRRPD